MNTPYWITLLTAFEIAGVGVILGVAFLLFCFLFFIIEEERSERCAALMGD